MAVTHEAQPEGPFQPIFPRAVGERILYAVDPYMTMKDMVQYVGMTEGEYHAFVAEKLNDAVGVAALAHNKLIRMLPSVIADEEDDHREALLPRPLAALLVRDDVVAVCHGVILKSLGLSIPRQLDARVPKPYLEPLKAAALQRADHIWTEEGILTVTPEDLKRAWKEGELTIFETGDEPVWAIRLVRDNRYILVTDKDKSREITQMVFDSDEWLAHYYRKAIAEVQKDRIRALKKDIREWVKKKHNEIDAFYATHEGPVVTHFLTLLAEACIEGPVVVRVENGDRVDPSLVLHIRNSLETGIFLVTWQRDIGEGEIAPFEMEVSWNGVSHETTLVSTHPSLDTLDRDALMLYYKHVYALLFSGLISRRAMYMQGTPPDVPYNRQAEELIQATSLTDFFARRNLMRPDKQKFTVQTQPFYLFQHLPHLGDEYSRILSPH